MTGRQTLLTIGIVAFDQPTLLVIGDRDGLYWLADLIGSGWTGKFSSLDDKVHLAGIELDAAHSGIPGGLDGSEMRFLWRLSDASLATYPEQIRALAAKETPGHIYLDDPSGNSPIEAIVSKGEYDPPCAFDTSPS